jgi:hypothetical protein
VGAEAEGDVVVESGLEVGERVVTAANFILDSESRLKGVFADMTSPGKTGPQATASQNMSVEILEPKAAKVGMNPVRLVVKDASGNAVTGAEVEVTLFMPPMGSMAPMSSKARLEEVGPGEYRGQIEVPMAWSWQTTVTVVKQGKQLGSYQTTLTAR